MALTKLFFSNQTSSLTRLYTYMYMVIYIAVVQLHKSGTDHSLQLINIKQYTALEQNPLYRYRFLRNWQHSYVVYNSICKVNHIKTFEKKHLREYCIHFMNDKVENK